MYKSFKETTMGSMPSVPLRTNPRLARLTEQTGVVLEGGSKECFSTIVTYPHVSPYIIANFNTATISSENYKIFNFFIHSQWTH